MDAAKLQEYLVRRISSQESYGALLRFPRFLEIETVNVCNARCPMCTIEDWGRNSKPMTDELFRKIADEVIANRDEVLRVSLYRDGEPLIDRKLPSRIAYLKRGEVSDVSIASNISLLSEQTAKDILEAGIDLMIMSVDSLKKDVYESIRVRLNFDEVLENALRFIELRNRIRPQTKIWIRMIRQESNRNEWADYLAYWTPKLAPHDRVYYHNIFNWGGQLENYRGASTSVETSLPCVALWSLMVISANGDVPLCNVDYNMKYQTGNVATDSIRQVWHSKILNQRRELHLAGQNARISLCKDCNVWEEPPDRKKIAPEYVNGLTHA